MSLDAKNVPVGVLIEKADNKTASFAASLNNSRYISPIYVNSRKEADRLLFAGTLNGYVVLRADFATRLSRVEMAPLQLILNGTDSNTARLIEGYIQGAWGNWLAQEQLLDGGQARPPVVAEPRVWFNPKLESRNFIVPGVIALILALVGAMLTAFVIAREWERGTMESMLVTPATMPEFLASKIVPYYLLGMGSMLLATAIGVWFMGVPFRGSFLVLILAGSVFLMTALTLGLLISTITKSQFVSAIAAVITTLLPTFILSGFIFDINSMPEIIQYVTYLFAARYFVAILQTLFMAGDIWSVILPNLGAMTIIATVFTIAIVRKTTSRLE